MKPPFTPLTQGTLRTEWRQVGFLLLLVLLLCSNLVGFIEFPGDDIRNIEFRPSIFQSADHLLTLPDIATTNDFLLLFFASIVLAIALPLLTPLSASVLVVITTIPFLYTGIYLPYRDTEISMEFNLLVILMLFGLNVLTSYFQDTHRKQELISVFGKFVPPQIVNELSKHPELLNLDGESKVLSIFFCDLKGFTSISEQLTPKQLVSLLNEYLTLMTSILYKHGATIDKYIGDSIMAFWGAPIPQEDHAQRAVNAAFEMQTALIQFSEDLKTRNLPTLSMGVGINTGVVNVGNMGSTYRLAYTALGDAVNLASRLESLTRIYSVPIIIGEESAKQLRGIEVRELDSVTVKGKNTASRIFEPMGETTNLSSELSTLLEKHQIAMQHYYENNISAALTLFKELAEEPEQADYYNYMISKLNKSNSSVQ